MKRRLTAALLCCALVLTALPAAAQAGGIEAIPSSAKVLVDGTEIRFQAYEIDGYNYFKLRDLAMALRDTDKGFSIRYSPAQIWLQRTDTTTDETNKYQPIGSEFQFGDGVAKSALSVESSSSFRVLNLNGAFQSEPKFTSYLIDDYHYFRLRELGYIFDFGVQWDEKNSAIIIDTLNEYQCEPSSFKITDSGEIIGEVYQNPSGILISDMPIVSYVIQAKGNAMCEENAMRGIIHGKYKNVFIVAEDLVNYGFDLWEDTETRTLNLYLNEDKTYGMLDGEKVNEPFSGGIESFLYYSNKHVKLDGKQVECFSNGKQTLISILELYQYYDSENCRISIDFGNNYFYNYRADPFDFFMMRLIKEFHALDESTFEKSISNYPVRSKKFSQIFGDTNQGFHIYQTDANYMHHEYIGWYTNGLETVRGLKIENKTPAPTTFRYCFNSYQRGIFQENKLIDGISYTSPHLTPTSSGKDEVVGNRYEGSRTNGYFRTSKVTQGPAHDSRFRFGYRVLCEGEVLDGKFSGYYRAYDDDGRLVFEGQYADYLAQNR